jgi:tripartite-type tricarboxylate transporter receptor subunit TctC
MRKIGMALATMLAVAHALPAQAQSVADFYRGKTINLYVGFGPGGGYDLYGRIVAEFLPRHLPGNPTIVVQNMPGAGSFVAARYMADVAPKDGTALGSLAQTLAFDSTINPSTRLAAAKFHYIGRATTNIDVGAALPAAGIKSFDDARQRQITVGASGGGGTTVMFPSALNAFAGAKFKIVRGYKGTTEIVLAMERREVDLVGAYGLPGIIARHPGWLDKGEATIIYQAALQRHRLIPNVPTMPELATSDEGRIVLRAIASTAEIGRSIVIGPDVPVERLAALRAAFRAMLEDPDFLAAAKQRNLMLDPATGEQMDDIVRETTHLAPTLIAKIGAALGAK